MNDEPTTAPIAEDDKDPATKGDLRKVESNLRTEIEGVDQRLMNVEQDVGELKQDVHGLKSSVASVLEIVKTIDENTRGIPAQVKRLNERVFPHR